MSEDSRDDPSVSECVRTFRGSCFGVGLKRRGPLDNHVMFVILVEDDGYWNVSRNSSGSSYWMPELIECFNAAKHWMETNCDRPDHWGWKFREK